MDSFKTYITEANKISYGKKVDRNNPEIKKLAVFLKSVNLKDVEIKITGEENIVNIYFKDPGYMPPARGAYLSIGGQNTMSGQDYEANQKKMKSDRTKLLSQLNRQKKVALEDSWENQDWSVGAVLRDFYT